MPCGVYKIHRMYKGAMTTTVIGKSLVMRTADDDAPYWSIPKQVAAPRVRLNVFFVSQSFADFVLKVS